MSEPQGDPGPGMKWISVEVPQGCTREDAKQAARSLTAHPELIEPIARMGAVPEEAQDKYVGSVPVEDRSASKVIALYEYGEVFALYVDTDKGRAAAEADAEHLRAEARARWETGHHRRKGEFVEPRLGIRTIEVRSSPRSDRTPFMQEGPTPREVQRLLDNLVARGILNPPGHLADEDEGPSGE